jgi:cyclopropane-fatty-acyl-phospholipid synthase
MRVAVVGAGVSGLAAAHELATSCAGGVDVTVYEKEDSLGGSFARTVGVDGGAGGEVVHLHLGFMPFNSVTSPNMMQWFADLGANMERSDMSFSVRTQLDACGECEWASSNGISGLLAKRSNALSPSFWRMISETLKFKRDALRYLEDCENNLDLEQSETLGQFVQSHGYCQFFQEAYLVLALSN